MEKSAERSKKPSKVASVNRKQDHLLIENRTTPDMR